MSEFRIAEVTYAASEPALRAVREAVFVREQGVPLELEWDGLDAAAVHVLAEGADGTPMGTGRLLPDGHIGRVAVLPRWRGRGVGRALVAALIEIARRRGLTRVHLSAQTHALPFYEGLGFVAEGEAFMDAGIPHRHMHLMLEPEESTPGAPGPLVESGVLGETTGTVGFDGAAENRRLARALCAQARHSVLVQTPDLEPRVYDDGELLDALRRLALAHPHTRIRVLIGDPERAVRHAPRLFELARRLTSSIELRRPNPEAAGLEQAFLVVDGKGLIHRPNAERHAGVASFHDPLQARALTRQFDAAWALGTPDAEFRRLHL